MVGAGACEAAGTTTGATARARTSRSSILKRVNYSSKTEVVSCSSTIKTVDSTIKTVDGSIKSLEWPPTHVVYNQRPM